MFVYLVENTVNHKVYVGQTTVSLKRRMWQHDADARSEKRRGRSLLHRAMYKYGKDKFEIQEIVRASTKIELDKLEAWYVEFFASTNKEIGYNIASGGAGPGKHSEETKKRISKGLTGRPVSEETRRRISIANKGNKRGLGKVCSEEKKRKIGDAQRGEKNHMWGKTRSAETRAKVSKALKGRPGKPHSEETRAKLSKALTGRPGRKHTAESRAKMSKAQRAIDRTGRKVSLETRQKMSKARMGYRFSEESKAKMSRSQMGHKVSDEARAKMAMAKIGHKASPETRARMSESQRKRKVSEEGRANISAGVKAAWARKKAASEGTQS